MLSTFQIIAIVILGLGVLTALAFTVAFVVVSCSKKKEETAEKVVAEKEEITEIDLDQMLAKLEEASKNVKKEEQVQEVVEEKEEVQTKEEPKQDDGAKVVINIFSPDAKVEKEEPKQEEKEESEDDELEKEEPEVVPVIVEEIKEVEEEAKEPVVVETEVTDKTAPEFDYRIRLEKIKESQAKIDRDLDKTSRAILKYERTIRRMERNQKMLDRRALELTNLNLLMYSVTDIKNVDAEKKARQEELTAHIAELKASIQDAQDYLDTNREKYESNLKLKEYLVNEQTRYADEVKELEDLIASGKYFDDSADGETNK